MARSYFKWTSQSEALLRSMRESNFTSQQIADALGLTQKKINWKASKLGLTADGRHFELKVRAERRTDSERFERQLETISKQPDSYAVGYVLGVLLGDGSISHQKRGGVILRLGVKDKPFAEKFQKVLSSVCPWGTKVRLFSYTYTRKACVIVTPERVSHRKASTDTTWTVTCCHRAICSYFEGLLERFTDQSTFSSEMERGVLDGLFDSEGYFVRKWAVGIKMTDHRTMRWISKRLSAANIKHTLKVTEYMSTIGVYNAAGIRKFCSMVSYSVPHREAARLAIQKEA